MYNSSFFQFEGQDTSTVHRVIKVHEKDGGDITCLTEGVKNEVGDLCSPLRMWPA